MTKKIFGKKINLSEKNINILRYIGVLFSVYLILTVVLLVVSYITVYLVIHVLP